MKKRKYRELLELKGLLRENNITYEFLSNYLKMSIGALSNKINGFSIFNLLEANQIIVLLKIPKETSYKYFF